MFYSIFIKCALPKRRMTGLKLEPRFYCKASSSLNVLTCVVLNLNVTKEVYSLALEFLGNVHGGGSILLPFEHSRMK